MNDGLKNSIMTIRYKIKNIVVENNLRYENDGYPPDVPGKVIYKVNYPNECSGCGYKKGGSICPYCGSK